jgi:putative ABC transport system ATP-binding protein
MLEIRDLVKRYLVGDGDPIRAVDKVSLSIAAGEMVALYGPSGSGKTTLLNLIAALARPDSGHISVDGVDLDSLSDAQQSRYRLHELGFVDQEQDLLPGANAVQNAAMKLWLLEHARTAEQRVRPLLIRLGLEARLHHRADQLSMGERQRVMLARALSTEPKLLLADEPTGNLDTQRSREVLGLIVSVCQEQGTAVLLATHDPQAAMFAHRVHSLRDGRLVDYKPDDALLVPGATKIVTR